MIIKEIQNGWCENEYHITNDRGQKVILTTGELTDLFHWFSLNSNSDMCYHCPIFNGKSNDRVG